MRWLVLCCVVGCWSQDLVDDTFTREEWDHLSTAFVMPAPVRCPTAIAPDRCDDAAELGHRLFFDERLSGAIAISDPKAPGPLGTVGKVECASCHDATLKPDGKRGFLVDIRSSPANVSSGAGYTRHNALSLVNLGYKAAVANQNCAEPGADPARCNLVFAWTGIYATAGEVLALANGAAAMNTNGAIMANLICTEPRYRELYLRAFDSLPGFVEPMAPGCAFGMSADDGATVALNLGIAFDAYLRRFESGGSRFDRYVSGTLEQGQTSNRDVLTEPERRGLRVFVREGMCIDCHGGPLLSDLDLHNTGVKQEGQNAPVVDNGLGAVTGSPGDFGKFLTPSLRHVAETAPYMHAGQYNSIAEVIEFYRRGGDDPASFSGRKDPRIQPLDITDEQAKDLAAFLGTLTGSNVEAAYAEPLP